MDANPVHPAGGGLRAVHISDKRLVREERRADERITIRAYDPSWPELYREERERIRTALGDALAGIEHAGSTAVPGLVAKPIVDIFACVAHLPISPEAIVTLRRLGYEDLGECGIPGRQYLRRRGERNFNLCIVQRDSSLWDDNLLFRDYLQCHPDEARRYARLKQRLAADAGHSLLLYSDRKGRFFVRTLQLARAWRRPAARGVG